VKNITVSVPDDVYRAARVHAARHNSSVSAMVAEFLRSLSADDDEFRRLVKLQEEIMGDLGDFSAAERLPRDELYDRAVR
jgi:plasmid stability protein